MLYEKLWPFQKKAADWALSVGTAGIFAEQGTGKTWITAGVIEKLLDDEFTALLVVPLSNISTTWEDLLQQLDVEVCRDWDSFKKAHGAKILLIHYEAMPKLDKKITKYKWTLAVFDESQRIKSRGSRQSRIAGRINFAERRIILSGTPFDDLLDDPQEIWAQFRFLRPTLFGKRWGDYENTHLVKTGYMGYKRKFRGSQLRVVLKKVKPYILRLEKEDVLDLPPIKYLNIPVALKGKQWRMYEEMERHMVTSLGSNEITADLVITQLVKLQQICGGFIKDDDEEIHELGRAKLHKLHKLVERNDFPLVIFAKYRFEVAQIASSLTGGNRRISTIEGKNRKTRAQTIRDFQDGKIDILIAQVRTGGVGIDLQTSCVAIFYSTTFSFIDFEQAVARLHRAGQERAVKIYLLYAKNTVDKLIYQSLLLKRDISETVLRNFKKQKSKQGDLTMAKKTKSTKPAADKKADKKDKAPKVEAKKYGITEMSDAMGIKPASVRVKLRNADIEKFGGRYGWDTKAEMNEVIDIIATPAKEEKD